MAKTSNAASELSPKYAVMGFLYLHPMHGYELHKHLAADLYEVWHISQSQAYNILKHLEKENFVTLSHQAQEKRPDKELLTLTNAGRTAFETWLYTPTPGSARAIRVEFISRLFFASQINTSLCTRLIEEQTKTIQAHLRNLRARLSLIPPAQVFNRMGLDLRIRQLEGILDWMEKSAEYFRGE